MLLLYHGFKITNTLGGHVTGLRSFSRFSISIFGFVLAFQTQALADRNFSTDGTPTCMNHGRPLAIDNEQALQWRAQQPSGFRSRAYISGTIDEVFPDQTGHRHFSIKIGPNPNDRIEVIFNEGFGNMPVPRHGQNAAACGDYIVATEHNGGYPPSPDGALVHWVHRSTNSSHDSGFVVIEGTVYGNN